jgi:hypothetical protein
LGSTSYGDISINDIEWKIESSYNFLDFVINPVIGSKLALVVGERLLLFEPSVEFKCAVRLG